MAAKRRGRRSLKGLPRGVYIAHSKRVAFAAVRVIAHKRHYLGTYDTIEEAAAVADAWRPPA